MEIWNLIVQSNTFNFIIFVIIFAIIIKRVKIGSMLEQAQNKVKEYVNNSDDIKAKSIIDLKDAEEAIKLAETEIKTILDGANEQAVKVENKILTDAEVQKENILQSADKVNDSNGKKIISDLSKDTALASVDLARKHIIETLKNKPEYHTKFIEDSINEIDRFTF